MEQYRHEIGGTNYLIRFAHLKNHRGDCTRPTVKRPEIRIRVGLPAEQLLEVILHECLHASNFTLLSEEWVEQTAVDLSSLLTKMGYKRDAEKSMDN